MPSRYLSFIAATAAAVALLAGGCAGSDETGSPDESSTSLAHGSMPSDDEFRAVATTYADLVHASYAASIESATTMASAVETFLAEPSDATLSAARSAWIAARADYGPTEAFRLYDGPIDDPDDGPEGEINAWPMDEAYVDYVDGDPSAGIVNDPVNIPEITADVLTAANEDRGETNISTGWHAIEFLLWGQDLDPAGPGRRPVTDYTTEPNASRRSDYLRILTQLLLDDLNAVAAAWDPTDGDYRHEFLSDPTAAVQRILRGIGALSAGELAGERMAVAYETKDQEDEHSCFSDNTNADVLANATGVRMVYLADLAGIDGPSPADLVAAVDPELDDDLRNQLDESVAAAENFPATFETMIAAPDGDPANEAFLAALESVEAQGELIAEAATALGLEISIEV